MFIQSVYIMKTLTRQELYIMPIICALRNGRTELLRDIGAAHEHIKAHHGIEFVVKNFAANYLQPAFLDDALVVRTTRSKRRVRR